MKFSSDDGLSRELEELYRDRYAQFLRVAFAITRSESLAEDAVQDAFARALRHQNDFRRDGAIDAWVWRTVLNVSLTARARRSDDLGIEAAVDVPSAHDLGAGTESSQVFRLISELPDRQKHAVFLRHYGQLSYKEIGSVLGVATGTVSASLHHAYETLRELLQEVPR